MTIKKDKASILLNIDKNLKLQLEQLAREDCRSLTSLINKILAEYVKDKFPNI